MFGIIYGLVNLGVRVIGGIQDALTDNEHKKTMYDSKTDTYLDHRFAQRDIKTNQLRYESIVNGDKCLMGYNKNGSYVVRNLDEERRQNELRTIKGNTKITVVQYNNDEHITDECPGIRFIDALNPSTVVVIRYLTCMHENIAKVYMDIKTGKAIRCTDGEMEHQEKYGEVLRKALNELWVNDKTEYFKRLNKYKKEGEKYCYKIYRNSKGNHKIIYDTEEIINKFNDKQNRLKECNSICFYGNSVYEEVRRV